MATEQLKPEERRALAKCRVAECFAQDGPELTDMLSQAADGAVRRSVYLALVRRGLIKLHNGHHLVTPLGLHLLNIE